MACGYGVGVIRLVLGAIKKAEEEGEKAASGEVGQGVP